MFLTINNQQSSINNFMKTKIYPTFLNLKSNYASAPIVILPVSYEGTVSYGKGTAKGPSSIIEASRNPDSRGTKRSITGVPSISVLARR